MTVDYERCLTAGMTARDAARACGVDVSAVRHWAARRGVLWRKSDDCVARALPEGVADLPPLADCDLPPLADCDLDAVACRALWASVLHDQWFWVFGGHSSEYAGNSRREALAWFGTRDSAIVCSLAGVDYEYVMLRYSLKLAEAGEATASPKRKPKRHRSQQVAS